LVRGFYGGRAKGAKIRRLKWKEFGTHEIRNMGTRGKNTRPRMGGETAVEQETDTVEAIEFYGFRPMRQIAYGLCPEYMFRHAREGKWQKDDFPPGFTL
jgi:hypothetical protein